MPCLVDVLERPALFEGKQRQGSSGKRRYEGETTGGGKGEIQ